MSRTILVTGATGYIARHIIAQLLNRGDTVIGSARTVDREMELRDAIAPTVDDPAALERFRLVPLSLTSDDGWADAMAGVDAVMHTASPFPLRQPKDAQEVIRPAVDGALHAMRAAQAAGVQNVVLTSSTVAITNGALKPVYDEADWSPKDAGQSAYARSKVMAERAAWAFVETEAPEMRLAVINPGMVLGTPLGDSFGASVGVIERMLGGKDPMQPQIGFPVCDVRDVALAHIRAMEAEGAAGHRHIIADRFMWFAEVGAIIREAVPDARTATREAPNFAIRLMGLFDPAIRSIVPQLGKRLDTDNTRMRDVLGIAPRDAADSVRETALWLAERA